MTPFKSRAFIMTKESFRFVFLFFLLKNGNIKTESNSKKSGQFLCVSAKGGNHRPVRMQDVSESPESEVTVKMREDEIKSYP